MIKTFPVGSIVVADAVSQDAVQVLLKENGIALQHFIHHIGYIADTAITCKILRNLTGEQPQNFQVRYLQIHIGAQQAVLRTGAFQVAGGQQHGVQIIGIAADFFINNPFLHLLADCIAVHQRLQILPSPAIQPVQHIFDNAVAGGVYPVWRRLAFGIKIHDDGPGVVDFTAAEAVAVIPFPDFGQLIL